MTTSLVPMYPLIDENTIPSPSIGFGTWSLKDEEAERAVLSAIELGYRLIDSATS